MKKILSLISALSSLVIAIAPINNTIEEVNTQITSTTPLDFQTAIQGTNNILDDNAFARHYSHRSHSSHSSHYSHSSHQSHSSHYSSYY